MADVKPAGSQPAFDVLPPGDSPDFASANLTILTESGDAHSRRLEYYPNPTLVVATAIGRVSWEQDWGLTGSWGPAGFMTGSGAIRGSAFIRGAGSNKWKFDFGINVQPWPGKLVDTVSAVVVVLDSIRADLNNPAIPGGYSQDHQCGYPTYPENPCTEFSGTMAITLERISADLEFTADSTSVKVGSTVKFTNRIVNVSVPGQNLRSTTTTRYVWIPDDTSRGGSPAEVVDSTTSACTKQSGDSTCTRVIQGSGRMKIIARVNGETIEATVRVNAIPCPTGDPVLDHKEIRTALMQMWSSSNADSAPGSGRTSTCRDANGTPVTCGYKKEQGIWIIKRLDGSYYAVPMTPTYHDECSIRPGNQPTPEPGAVLWAVAHSHPSKTGEKLYCDTQDQHGKPADLYNNDPVGKWTAKKGRDYSAGGGSVGDWKWAQSSPNIDVYVMNKNDEIYRLPAYTPKGDEKKDVKQRRKYWRGNNATCPF